MKKTFLTVLLAGVLGSASEAAVNNDAFFPMQKGFSWVYNTTKKGKKEPDHFEMKVEITGPWKQELNPTTQKMLLAKGFLPGPIVHSSLSGMIMTQKDKRGSMREFLTRTDQGIFIYKLGLSKGYTPEVDTSFSPPVPRVIYPLEPGTQVHWEGHLKVAWVDKPIIFDGVVAGWEDIEVPAGKFHCIKLHYHEKRGDEVIDEDAWYAEGVGQVKYDGGQYVKELKSYRRGDTETR